MNRLLATLIAGAATLAFSTSILGADAQSRDNQTQNQPNATQGKPEQSDSQRNSDRMKDDSSGTNAQDRKAVGANDPAKNQASDQANRKGAPGQTENTQGSDSDPAYAAELKKCDSMQGDSKQKCITAAKKKAGQM